MKYNSVYIHIYLPIIHTKNSNYVMHHICYQKFIREKECNFSMFYPKIQLIEVLFSTYMINRDIVAKT